MNNAIEILGCQNVLKEVTRCANAYGIPASLHIEYVCSVCCNNLNLAPNLNERTEEQRIERWVKKFQHGYTERISQRKSKMPGTIPDDAVNIIIKTGLAGLSEEQADSIIYAHRLAMSAENILGLLLEEFLFEKLSPLGWAMAWGETVKSVDFCNAEGIMLQIKNRSNSENSSSSKIREGKPIKKWFRVNATNGCYGWDNLTKIIGQKIPDLDEDSFQRFIQHTLSLNPNALPIEPQNPWLKFKN